MADDSADGRDHPEGLEAERQRQALLQVLAAGRPGTLEQKVAWILNNYPETRNSDIKLLLKYWEIFDSDIFSGGSISPGDLFKLTRETSISRARARVQNQLKLFLADPDIRRRRGTLAEEEREGAHEKAAAYPVYAVWMDESGKSHDNVLVGSVWVLHGHDTWQIASALKAWREHVRFDKELKFSQTDGRTLEFHKRAMDIVMSLGAAISFKVITVPRAGTRNVQDVVARLMHLLLVRGIEHEHATGRAPLPRTLQVWKDAEEEGYDKLVLADLRERLMDAAKARFDGMLHIDSDSMVPVSSKGNDLIQIADLFSGAVNRVVNQPGGSSTRNPKDELAEYILDTVRISIGSAEEAVYDDLAVRLSL